MSLLNKEEYDPEQIYQRLITEAPNIPGDTIDKQISSPSDIPWFDQKLVESGQQFMKRNKFSQVLVFFAAYVYGIPFKSVTTALLRTGKFRTQNGSIMRSVDTEVHVAKWLRSENLLDTLGSGFKDLQFVRKLHFGALKRCVSEPLELIPEEEIPDKENKQRAIEALKKDLKECLDLSDSPLHLCTYNPKVYFSQFDMAMVIYGMYSPIYLFPRNFGVSDTSCMDGYLHFWAVIGRILGLEDRYNLALYPNRELQLKVLNKIGIPFITEIDLTCMHLGQIYMDGLASYGLAGGKSDYIARYYNGYLTGTLPGFKGENIYKLLTWSDLFKCYMSKWIIDLVYYFPLARMYFNKLVTFRIWNLRRQVMKKSKSKVSAL